MKILHLEDNPADVELVRALLRSELAGSRITSVDTRDAYLDELRRGGHDVILSDYSLPGIDGREALDLARQYAPDLPFIFFSGSIGEDRAIETLRAGAADYVLKDNLKRLRPALERAVRDAQERHARHQMEAQLEERDARLRAIFDHEPECIKLLDREGRVLEMNPAGLQMIEAESFEQVRHQSIHPFIVEEHRDAFRSLHEDTLRGRDGSLEFSIVGLKGGRRWMETHTTPFRDHEGRIVAVLALTRDITERKRAEDAIRRSEERYRRLVEHARDIIFTIDHGGLITSLNPAFGTMTGWPREQWINRKFPDLVHHDDLPAALDLFHRVRRGEHPPPLELRINTVNGGAVDFEFTVTSIGENGRQSLLGVGRDITERNRALARIHEQAEIINHAPVAIVITDLAHRVTYCNEGARSLYGLAERELVGHTADELFSAETMQILGPARQTALAKGSWRGDVPIHTRDGRDIIVEFLMNVIRDSGGRPQGRLSIGVDVTEKKRLEEQFFRAQRMENLGLLAAGIAHDLNNILAPILMAAPLLRTRASSPADQRLLVTLEHSAERGAALVRQILSFAQGTGGERLTIQPKHIAREIAAMIEETFPRTIRLETDLAADLWPINVNPTHLHQVLLNLCVNARDAMPQGGILRLAVRNCQLTAATAAAIPDGRPGTFTVFEVSDTGTGIPPAILARIWEPFFTTKGPKRGTGLGLSTVRGIVNSHDGFCEVQTAVGAGTTFRVYLPAIEADASSGNSGPAPAIPRGQGELVLVVDDEPPVRDLIRDTLTAHGYRVLLAADGVEAVACYTPRCHEIDLVIADVHMPYLDGSTLALVLRRLNPALRLLAISGLSDDHEKPGIHPPAPGDAFLQKPFKAGALLGAVHELLHARAMDTNGPAPSAEAQATLSFTY
jgi:PAS domain S-box-containing protein